MDFYGYIVGAAGLMGLAAGLALALRSRRTLRRLDHMLTAAIAGGFAEDTFSESALSALESRMARFLSGCAAANRNLAGEKEAIKSLIADISTRPRPPSPTSCSTPPCSQRGNCLRSSGPRQRPSPPRRRNSPSWCRPW